MCVLLYAFIAGVRTVSQPHLFWQMRDARYLVETHRIAGHDLFSYTASGAEWRYPQLSGLIFYGLYRVGGYEALTWLGALACLFTVAMLLLIRPGLLASILCVLAVPLIAWRTAPRAELFTTVLFAVFLSLLFRHRRIWLLPILMVAWVNLHPGFVLGIGLIVVFAALRFLFSEPSEGLVLAIPLCLLASLANPFGPYVWRTVVAQVREAGVARLLGREWAPPPWSWWRIGELLRWRDPDSAFWFVFFAGAVIVVIALLRWHWLPGFLVVASCAAALYSVRVQAIAAMCVCGAGAYLGGVLRVPRKSKRRAVFRIRELRLTWEKAQRSEARQRTEFVLGAAAVAALVLLAGVRCYDLVSNRYYLSHARDSVFGIGVAYCFPERAAAFIRRETLPGRLMHEYGMGGFLSWRLGPRYPVFVDGRAAPFSRKTIEDAEKFFRESPDSAHWQQVAGRWGISTIVLSLDRHMGLPASLGLLCGSRAVRLVYLDDEAAVFLRDTARNRPWIERHGQDCPTAAVTPSAAGEPQYTHAAQAAGIYAAIGRDADAQAAIADANRLFPADPELHLLAAQLYLKEARLDDARAACRRAIKLDSGARAWFALGQVEEAAGNHEAAAKAFEHSARTASIPYVAWHEIGESYLSMGKRHAAIPWLEKALAVRHSAGAMQRVPPRFVADVAAQLARARFDQSDLNGAMDAVNAGLDATPNDSELRAMKAELFIRQRKWADARNELNAARRNGAQPEVIDRLNREIKN